MIPDLIGFACNALSVACAAEPPRQPRRGEAPQAGWWTAKVPHALKVVPIILAYARQGERVKVEVNDVEVASISLPRQPYANAQGLVVTYDRAYLSGQTMTETATVPYPDDQPLARPLCSGQWTRVGRGEVKFDRSCLLPKCLPSGDSAVISWNNPPGIRIGKRFLRWATTIELQEIVISPTHGDFIAHGFASNFLPRLQWA